MRVRRHRGITRKVSLVAVVVVALLTSCSSSKPSPTGSAAPSAADVRAYAASTCGAVRGLRSVMQSIQRLQPALAGDTQSRAALKARYAQLLGTAAAAATAGEGFLERATLPKGPDAAAHARGVEEALTRLSADYRTWQREVAGFAIDDRDNWEDGINTLNGRDMGTTEHNWDRVLHAVGAGKIGRSVNAAVGPIDECRSVLVPLANS